MNIYENLLNNENYLTIVKKIENIKFIMMANGIGSTD